jgi:hypothetical protein
VTKPLVAKRRLAGVPIRILGWIIGALSVVNLIQDVNWITMKGAIFRWVDGYERLVTGSADFLFGWIDVSWLHVSAAETHAIVLLAVFLSSNFKAWTTKAGGGFVATALLSGLRTLTYLIMAAIALILPDRWGYWVFIGLFIVFLFGFLLATFDTSM